MAAFSSAESRRAAARTRTALSSGGSVPAGSTCRSSRVNIADRAASAWSTRAIGRAHRALAPDQATGQALVAILDWLTLAGQACAAANGCVPRSAQIRQLARTTLQRITGPSGTSLLS